MSNRKERATSTTRQFVRELYARQHSDEKLRRRVLSLADYAREVAADTWLTPEQIFAQYGSTTLPIAVPLKPGESETQYEELFRQSLAARGIRLYGHKNERSMRIEFARKRAKEFIGKSNPSSTSASAQSHGNSSNDRRMAVPLPQHEQLQPATRDDRKPYTRKRARQDSPLCPGQQSDLQACLTCGCVPCLRSGIRMLAAKVAVLESERPRHQEHGAGSGGTIDLTGDAPISGSPISQPATAITHLVLSRPKASDLNGEITGSLSARASESVPVFLDPIETKLVTEYEAINDQVVMNEKVLESSAVRLANAPVHDIQETTQLQDENQELRELIQREIDNRNTALAILVVYLWRHETSDLETMVSDPTATNVLHVQHASHHKCAQLSSAIEQKRKTVAQLKTQLDAAMADDAMDHKQRATVMSELGAQLSAEETEIQTLQSRRKREFMTLIQFDERVRLLIRALLARV